MMTINSSPINWVFVCRVVGIWGAALVLCAGYGSSACAAEDTDTAYVHPGIVARPLLKQSANEQIDPFTGTLNVVHTDVHLPGSPGLDILVQRFYRSPTARAGFQPQWAAGGVGVGWQMHFGRLVKGGLNADICQGANWYTNDNPRLEFSNGSSQLMVNQNTTGDPFRYENAATSWASPTYWKLDCSQYNHNLGTGTVSAESPSGLTYAFDTAKGRGWESDPTGSALTVYYVTKISDRFGNSLQFEYLSDNQYFAKIKRVEARKPDGQLDGRAVDFTWIGSGETARLDTMSWSNGTNSLSTKLEYTTLPNFSFRRSFLTKVSPPAGSPWTFDYYPNTATDGVFALKTLTWPTGGKTEYEYTTRLVPHGYAINLGSISYFRTGVTKRTHDGMAWTYAYTPGAYPGDPFRTSNDVTVVTSPYGSSETYTFVSAASGYTANNGFFTGKLWMIGLPLSHEIRQNSNLLESESYSWTGVRVSGELYTRTDLWGQPDDDGTYAPYLSYHVKTRNGVSHATSITALNSWGLPTGRSETGPSGTRTHTYTYCSGKFEQAYTLVGVGSIDRDMDPVTCLPRSVNRFGTVHSFTYHTDGTVRTAMDSNYNSVLYENYRGGVPQNITRRHSATAIGNTLIRTTIVATRSRSVRLTGAVESETDEEGNTTTYTLDNLDRVRTIQYPNSTATGATVTYTSATTSVPESYSLTRGDYVETGKYDGYGRLVEAIAGGVKTTYGYDAQGRKTFESYPVDASNTAPTGTEFAYDGLNRLTSVKHPGGTSIRYTYTAGAGLLQTQIQDERDYTTTQVFRSYGDPDGAETMEIRTPVAEAGVVLQRNGLGQITRVTQNGLVRNYEYNARFHLTKVTNPETGDTVLGRDGVGNLTSVQVGTAGTTYFDLDPLDRVWRIRYPDSTKDVTKDWYKNGKLKAAGNGTTNRTWSYDANWNLKEEALDVGGHQFLTTYAYDGNDRLTTVSYPKKGSTLSLNPDVLGRPRAVGSFVSTVGYHPNGMIKTMTYANSVVSAFEPDTRMRPRTLSVGRGGGTAYVGMTLDYDNASNVSTVTDTANASNGRTYGYDGIDRMTSVNGSLIRYDGSGNITQQNFGGTLDYVYDPVSNRLNSTSGIKPGTYSYDARGNVSSNGAISFQYDDNSRLRCAKCGTADEIGYDYDGVGMRVSRTKGGQTTYQVHNSAGNLILEFNPAANQRQEHIYLQGQKVATSTQAAYFATSVALSASSAAITPGQTVALTATVGGGRTPDGVVNFYDNGVFIGSGTIVNGRATLTTSALDFGYHNFSASYAGDGANAVSTTAVATRVESGQVTATIMSIINSLLLDD